MFLFLLGFVSASVDIDGYDVKKEYSFSEEIKGAVNLTIEGEFYDEMIEVSEGSDVELGEFLEVNGVDFECFPSDCSMSYSSSSGAAEKLVSFSLFEDNYVGFVVTGSDVLLDSVEFKIASDFGKEVTQPLTIEFFEREFWGYSEFSDDFLLKNWGCFDSVNKKEGPLVGNSFYCEMIDIKDSDVLRVGADVTGGTGELDMVVYPESGFGASWECSFDPASEEGCLISADIDDVFSGGNYQVCVGAESLTEYKIYEDKEGEVCGFAYDNGPESSVKDYGVYAQGVKYADATAMGAISFGADYVEAANYIISDRYHGDCSDGCILPLKVSGVSQNFRIYDASLTYTASSEWQSTDLIYDLGKSSAKVDFNGILDLELLGIVVEDEGEYYAELSGEDLFRENVALLPAPIITSIFPKDPPAGVPITFYANVDFDGNKSLSYKWDFGDGQKAESNVPKIVHAYNDLNNYTLTVEVSAGGNLTSEKDFEIEVISPEEAISIGMAARVDALKDVRTSITEFFVWYESALFGFIELAKFEDEIGRLERAVNNSFDAQDFRDVAVDLYALNIPNVVWADKFEAPFLMSELGDVNIEPVSIISGGVTGAVNADYIKPILTWQNENVDILVKGEDIFVSYLDGSERTVLSSYSFEVTPRSDRESYFVINKPFGELYFNGASGARKAGDSATVIILQPNVKVNFEFYYMGSERGSFFISPKLSSIVIEADIDTTCNHDLVCDERMGENSDNCRSDCKPTGKAWTFFVLAVILFLVVYTALQIWYKKHYEAYLFRDGAQLYNLLMYVTNARARGLEDKQIDIELRAQGWSAERVDYVLKKSVGKTIGMIEIIPIERISAWWRNRKAKAGVAKAMEVAKRVQQQGSGVNVGAPNRNVGIDNSNINKPGPRI